MSRFEKIPVSLEILRIITDKNFVKTDQFITNLQSQIDKLVVSGDSSPQATAASVDIKGFKHNSLKSRLDSDQQNIMLQLDTKASKSDVQQMSLSFKESFSTVAELNSAYPSGDSYNHAVLSDGMIYTFVRGSWINTNIRANGTGIANDSITISKLSPDIKTGLVDLNIFSDGFPYLDGFYSIYGGVLQTGFTGYHSKKVTVNPGDKVYISCNAVASNGALVMFYDKDDKFLSAQKPVTSTGPVIYKDEPIIAPSNCKYLGISTRDRSTYPIEVKKESIVNIREIKQETSIEIERLKVKNELLSFDNAQSIDKNHELEKRVPFEWKELSEAYVMINFDDGNPDLSDVQRIFSERDVPLTASVISNTLNNVMNNGQTLLELSKQIEKTGGEVMSHGIDWRPITDQTTFEEALVILRDSKRILESNGLSIKGFTKVGGQGALDNLGKFESIVSRYYSYGFSAGENQPYNMTRIWLNNSITNLKIQVDQAITNKSIICFYGHGLSLPSEPNLTEGALVELINYIKDKEGVQIVTPGVLFKQMGSTSLENRISKLELSKE